MLKIIEEIKNVSGTNDKINLISKQKDNEGFKRILRLTYDNKLIFKIKKFKKPSKHTNTVELDRVLDWLEFELAPLKGVNNSVREVLETYLEELSEENSKIVQFILGKDLKAGFSIKSINKAFGYEYLVTPRYMGAISFNKKKLDKLFETNHEIWSEVKFDGMYVNLFIEDNIVYAQSRGGKTVNVETSFEDEVKSLDINNKVLMGELLIDGVDRYTSNGMINSYNSVIGKQASGDDISKDIEKFEKKYNSTLAEVKEKIYIQCWDIVSLEDYKANKTKKTLSQRRVELTHTLKNSKKIRIVQHTVVKSVSDCMREFKRLKELGEEGIIVKDSTVLWKDGKPNQQMKFKLEFDTELKVVGYQFGNTDTKYEKFINRLECISKDGLVKTTTSALTEDDMEVITEMGDDIIGKIITVQCSGLSENRQGEKSLLHPRFVIIRDDKDEADDFNTMLKIEEMCNSL